MSVISYELRALSFEFVSHRPVFISQLAARSSAVEHSTRSSHLASRNFVRLENNRERMRRQSS